MAQKPSIPKGTRDFSPEEVVKRNYIINTMKQCFSSYGYQPIETPSFERSETLMGKYGEEGDRLIFKILDSGEFYEKRIESKIENTISIYVAVTYIFHDFVRVLIKNIRKNNQEFSTKSELMRFLKDDMLKKYTNDRVEEWGNLLIDDYLLADKFKKLFISKYDEFATLVLNFISEKGIDFDKKINDKIFIKWQIKWADRKIIKDFVKEYLSELSQSEIYYDDLGSKQIGKDISEKALRYDLTVPFARYVVQYQNDITFPFKRYQIQPVWRADRPQKGRFREFYQCDADVVGSRSLWQEVELIQLYDEVFNKLNLTGVTIKLNNRKILSGIAEVIGAEDKLIDFTIALDKLEKIGKEGVVNEMISKGISETAINKLDALFDVSGTASEKLSGMRQMLASSETGLKGIAELEFIIDAFKTIPLKASDLEIDVTLARGLNYYTGAIYEVIPPEGVNMGSIGGGGRYDDLTGIFGLKDMSGIGISFGLDRIYLVLEELGLFPKTVTENTKVLFINFGEKESFFAISTIAKLRDLGIASELYPEAVKMGKQMIYADRRKIPYVVLAGEEEMKTNTFTLKKMKTGKQQTVTFNDLRERLKKRKK